MAGMGLSLQHRGIAHQRPFTTRPTSEENGGCARLPTAGWGPDLCLRTYHLGKWRRSFAPRASALSSVKGVTGSHFPGVDWEQTRLQASWKIPERQLRAGVGVSELCRSCWGSSGVGIDRLGSEALCAPTAMRGPFRVQVPHLGLTACP